MSAGNLPLVSLIFPAKNEGDLVRSTIESLLEVKTDYPFEIIIMDDGSTHECVLGMSNSYRNVERVESIRTEGIGLARTKNLGAEYAQGDYFIFCDAHLFFEDYWLDRLLDPIRSGKADGTTPAIAPTDTPDIAGYGQSLNENLGIQWNAWHPTPFPSAVMPGGCFAVSRDVFIDIGGFDHKFKGWGYEDVEITLKMWLFGYKCFVQPAAKVLHLFRETYPYPVSSENLYYNVLRMAYSHFNEERIQKCKKLIKNVDVDRLESSVLEDAALAQRKTYLTRRLYDDSWFMQKFNIPF